VRVYHGSYTEVNNIDLSKGEVGKDFGLGFYVTSIKAQAEYWAIRKGRRHHAEGIVTEFEFDENIPRIMNFKLLKLQGYSSEWFDFVVLNRANNTEIQVHDYDIVDGAVADDDINKRLVYYLNGSITKEQFLSELTYKEPSHQICFCTVQSLQALLPVKGGIDTYSIDTDNNIVQSIVSDFDISELDAADKYYTSNLYRKFSENPNIFREKSWQEIYKQLKQELKIL
jgi:hypothetical protein